MTEDERDARLGFAALCAGAGIPPALDDDGPHGTLCALRRLVLAVGPDSPERRRIVRELDRAIAEED